MVRRAGIDDAPGVADLVRRAFSTQSRPTNPPSGALKETAADEAERGARRRGLARMTLFDLPRAGVPAMVRAMERLAGEVKPAVA